MFFHFVKVTKIGHFSTFAHMTQKPISTEVCVCEVAEHNLHTQERKLIFLINWVYWCFNCVASVTHRDMSVSSEVNILSEVSLLNCSASWFLGELQPLVLSAITLFGRGRIVLFSPATAGPAGSPGGGWRPWWWREACGTSEREDAAEGPGGSSLRWPGSPSASQWAFWSGRSRKWWRAAPFQRGSGAPTGSSPPPKPPPCTGRGSGDASSPRPQLGRWQWDEKSSSRKTLVVCVPSEFQPVFCFTFKC